MRVSRPGKQRWVKDVIDLHNEQLEETYQPAPDRVDHASTKAAVDDLSKGLAQQLIGRGIRVNVVAPRAHLDGPAAHGGVDPETLPDFGAGEAPIGRAAQPMEQAPAYVFFTSAESSFVVGDQRQRRSAESLMS